MFPDSAKASGEAPAFSMDGSPMTRDDLDGFDLAILRELRLDGRLSIADLADRIRLTKSPTQARLRRLERDGFITGYQARLDLARLGQGHVVFVEVKLSDTREHALGAFNAAVRALPAIEECHMIAGAFDYLLKVRSADIHAYRRILAEQISALPHVAATSTHVAMEAVKEGGR